MLEGVVWRVGVVDKWEESCGWVEERWARKKLRVLIVRGMPLKEMHLRPISRMNSAGSRSAEEEGEGEEEDEEEEGHREEASVRRGPKEEGELRVKVAAAWFFLDFSKFYE